MSSSNTSLFNFHNSTSTLSRLHFQPTSSNGICLLDCKSVILISACSLDVQSKLVPFHSSGKLKLDAIQLTSQFISHSLHTLVLTQDNPDSTSSVILSNTILTDIVLSPSLGTFLSTGPLSTQSITHSSFQNITLSDPSSSSSTLPLTENDECLLNSVDIQDSQETFYGILCSGLTQKTLYSFSSTNSSFERCIREFHPLSLHSYISATHSFSSRSNDAEESNCIITTIHSTCTNLTLPGKQTLAGKNTFTLCTFSCKTKGNGGALYFDSQPSQSQSSLEVQNCTFLDCKSTQDLKLHPYSPSCGGAIYADTLSDVCINASFFSYCIASYGGGVFIDHTQNSFSLSSCRFIECSSSNSGSGVFLQSSNLSSSLVLTDCLFLSNHCDNSTDNSTENYGGGACIRFQRNHSILIANCLFLENKARNGGGIFAKANESPSIFSIQFSFFSYNSVSGCGEDIFLEGFTDNPILSSFTSSLNPVSVSSMTDDQCIYLAWLPQALWYITNDKSSDTKVVVDRDATITYKEDKTIDTIDYGCGLQGVSYPNTHSFFSSTQAQANNNSSSFSSVGNDITPTYYCQTLAQSINNIKNLSVLFKDKYLPIQLYLEYISNSANNTYSFGATSFKLECQAFLITGCIFNRAEAVSSLSTLVFNELPDNDTQASFVIYRGGELELSFLTLLIGSSFTAFDKPILYLDANFLSADAILPEYADDGSVYLTNCSISSAQDSLIFKASIIVAISGTLELEACTFTNFSMEGSPLIEWNTGVALSFIRFNQFVSISRQTGNGSVFSFTVTNPTLISFNEITFSNCCSENGGAISAEIGAFFSFTFSSCKFHNCTANSTLDGTGSGGALCFTTSNYDSNNISEFIIKNCYFTQCSSRDRGGSLYMDEHLRAEIDSCYFKSCTAYTGGAIFSHQYGIHNLSDCFFVQNTASSEIGGGAIYTAPLNSSTPFNQLLFLSNTAPRGADISLSTEYNFSPCWKCYSNSPAHRFYNGNSDADFIDDVPSSASVSLDGNNTSTCFSSDEQCATVEFVLNMLTIYSILITFSDSSYSVPHICLNITQNQELSSDINITGETNNESFIYVTLDQPCYSLHLKEHACFINSLMLSVKNNNAQFASVYSGTLSLNSMSFLQDIAAARCLTSSLIVINKTASLVINGTLSDSTFSSIQSAAKGAVISADVASGAKFSITGSSNHTTFFNCISTAEDGGAIYLTTSSSDASSSLSLSSVSFVDCKTNSTLLQNMFIEALSNLDFLYSSAKNWNITKSDHLTSDLANCAVFGSFRVSPDLFYTTDLETLCVPPPNGTIISHINATNFINCGSKMIPCETITYAYSQNSHTILLHSSEKAYSSSQFSITETVYSDLDISAEVPKYPPSLDLSSGPCYTIDATYNEFKISYLQLSISHNSAQFVKILSGTLFLSNLDITVSSEFKSNQNHSLNQPFVSASDISSLQIEHCLFANITFQQHSLFQINSINHSILESSSSSFNISNTTFKGITRNIGNGSVLEMAIQESQYVSVSSTNFTDCSCFDGNGGALFLSLKKNGILLLGAQIDTDAVLNTNFTNCSAGASSNISNIYTSKNSTDDSCGGAIYLSIENAPEKDNLMLKNLQFYSCSAQTGKSMFVYTVDSSLLWSNSLWLDIREKNKPNKNDFVIRGKNGKERDLVSSFSPIMKGIIVLASAGGTVLVGVPVIIIIIVCTLKKRKKLRNKDIPLLEHSELYSTLNAPSTESALQSSTGTISISSSEFEELNASEYSANASVHGHQLITDFPGNSASLNPALDPSNVDFSLGDISFDQQKLNFE